MQNRLYEAPLLAHFRDERQMAFLMGPRQVGKTTTARRLGELRAESLYLNWDNFDHQARLLAGPQALADELELDRQRDAPPLLILDEIHKYPRWRNFLKGFFDTWGERVDLLVTGSARLHVFHAGGDSLMGRYFGYRMHPLSVAELVDGDARAAPGKRPPTSIDADTFAALLTVGGFPEPFLRQSEEFVRRWQRLRQEQLFREELRDLTRIHEVTKVRALARLLEQRAGQLVSYTTLANGVGASIDSIKRWIEALEGLYYCFAVRPWHRNVARALRKEPKFFLWDWSLLADPGARFENLVAGALLKAAHFWTDRGQGDFALHFVRDKDKREVDFLVTRDHEPWLLAEAKLSGKGHLSKSLIHFAAALGVPHAVQVAADLEPVDRDAFALDRPSIVPARSFLTQLV